MGVSSKVEIGRAIEKHKSVKSSAEHSAWASEHKRKGNWQHCQWSIADLLAMCVANSHMNKSERNKYCIYPSSKLNRSESEVN